MNFFSKIGQTITSHVLKPNPEEEAFANVQAETLAEALLGLYDYNDAGIVTCDGIKGSDPEAITIRKVMQEEHIDAIDFSIIGKVDKAAHQWLRGNSVRPLDNEALRKFGNSYVAIRLLKDSFDRKGMTLTSVFAALHNAFSVNEFFKKIKEHNLDTPRLREDMRQLIQSAENASYIALVEVLQKTTHGTSGEWRLMHAMIPTPTEDLGEAKQRVIRDLAPKRLFGIPGL